jgi:hypothetical protein
MPANKANQTINLRDFAALNRQNSMKVDIVDLPKGTGIMKPRTVWSLFGKPSGGIEVRNYQTVTSDMYSTFKLD